MFIKLVSSKQRAVSGLILFSAFCFLLSVCFASPKTPHRIISLNPSVTEILFSLNLDNEIIAVTNNCNYPPQAKKKPKIGDINLNYEKIISLAPDLIIAENSIFKDTLTKLKNMGLPVFVIDCDNLEKFKKSFLLVGRKTGKGELSIKLIRNFDKRLNEIKSRRDRSRPVPKIFIEIWNQPLMTAADGTFFDDIIEIAGAVNIAKKIDSKYPVVNTEFLIKNNPDIIILTTGSLKDIYGNKTLKDINAVKNKKVYKINPDIIARPTLRLADAAEQIQGWVKN